MGMAAGQARLLSITTRMSDNELRAQLINNDKMRLATKSAQVSEAYTTALNEAQMMFTNYDADNKTSYKELTYNALTAYNPYNNQYAISNASGQVLVSETDATNFKNANGDLNTFLASYGLEYSTDYFSSLISTNVVNEGSINIGTEDKPVIVNAPYLAYKTGETDAKNNAIYDYISFADYSEVGGATLTEVLQNMYNGVDKTHPGYDATKSSLDYLTYTGDLANYEKAYSSMLELINDKMSTELQKVEGEDHAIPEPNKLTFAQAYETFSLGSIPNTENWKDWLYVLSNIIGVPSGTKVKDESGNEKIIGPTGLYKDASKEGAAYLDQLRKFVNDNNKDYFESSYYNETPGAKQGSLTYEQSGADTILTYKDANASDSDAGMQFKKTDPNTYTLILKNADGSYTTLTGEELRETPGKITYTYYVNDDGTIDPTGGSTECKVQIDANMFKEGNYDNGKLNDAKLLKNIVDLEQNTDDNRKNVGAQVVKEIQNGITNIWDYAASDGTNGAFSKFTDAKLAGGKFQTFLEAAKKFYKDMFGDDIINNPTSSDDILFKMNNIEELKKAINAKAKNTENDQNATAEAKAKAKAAAESFKKIYDVYILDCVMNTYGEPKFTWIDQNNKNANGEHKAQWYTNLFNRMKTGGYKTLQDGLASSTEWIKFAFESGLVTLEQVDGSNTWNSTTYSNCSDITEQTNSTAVTIAEAEYNAQMNKIQNKDKMYDLELKNIDTEHNSLQTEYESIKGAIDKNIERTFKIYS